MTQRDEFTVTLPSNSNMSTEPNNNPADYTVHLRTPPQLSGARGEWEAALLNIQYTPDFAFNFKKVCPIRVVLELHEKPKPEDFSQYRIRIVTSDGISAVHPVIPTDSNDRVVFDWCSNRITTHGAKAFAVYKLFLPPNYYSNIDQLCNFITDDFNAAFPPEYRIRMRFYAEGNQRALYIFGNGYNHMFVEDDYLLKLLGFSKYSEQSEYQIPPLIMLNDAITKPTLATISSAYVYTDVIECQAVGDSDAPLLGIVPVSTQKDRTQWTFDPPCYLPVNRTTIDSIRIILRNDRGEPIQFASDADPVVCTMRFRRAARHD
jgi:hypothetical protein